MDLTAYDIIVINSSSGKDSQAMLDMVVELADAQGVDRSKLIVAHADLGRVEWKGSKALAAQQAASYGIRFMVQARPQGDLLVQVEDRGMWPSSTTRFCTSEHKRGQINVLFTAIKKEWKKETGEKRAIKILNCMGHRAQESTSRSKMAVLETNTRATGKGTQKQVTDWRPIHAWTEVDVWARIKTAGTQYHYAYDLGMPRLSCVFCIFAPKAALMIAGKHNPELLDEYVRVEQKIGHTFKNGFAIKEIQDALNAGETVPAVAQGWAV